MGFQRYSQMQRLAFRARALSLAVLSLLFIAGNSGAQESTVKRFGYRIVSSYPADINAFTQGLSYFDGYLYVGTGKRGQSRLTKQSLETGEMLQSTELSSRYFGEGIEIVGDRIFQLTWQSNLVYEYDLATFEQRATHYNPTEGWGLAFDGETLYLSDGSSTLHKVDPQTFAFTGSLEVTYNNQPVTNLNELEFIHGEIWANVWQTEVIVRIDPLTGRVNSIVDLSGLAERTARNGAEAVLNGIAYDAEADRLLVTGKYWSTVFEIDLIDKSLREN